MNLTDDAMQVSLRITAWSGRLYDRHPRPKACAVWPPARATCTAAASTTAARLPGFLRRERFVDLTAGIVAARRHPLLARSATLDDLARCPWIDYDAAASIAPGDPRPSLLRLLAELNERTATHVHDVIRTASAGLLLMTTGPYLAWLSLELLERLPGAFLRPLPLAFGRFRYRSGFVARRSAEDVAPFRRLEAIVRETTVGQQA